VKKISIIIAGMALFVLINGCSKNPQPQYRIENEQAGKISVKIQTSESGKATLVEVEANQTTSYERAPEGNITVTSVTQNESVSFRAANNIRYTIVIGANKPPLVRIDQ
jgi:PBP1b-binding outer membrane lipoprotein LpoB